MKNKLHVTAMGVLLAASLGLQSSYAQFDANDDWTISKSTLLQGEAFTVNGPGKLKERDGHDISAGNLPLGPKQYRGFCIVPASTPQAYRSARWSMSPADRACSGAM